MKKQASAPLMRRRGSSKSTQARPSLVTQQPAAFIPIPNRDSLQPTSFPTVDSHYQHRPSLNNVQEMDVPDFLQRIEDLPETPPSAFTPVAKFHAADKYTPTPYNSSHLHAMHEVLVNNSPLTATSLSSMTRWIDSHIRTNVSLHNKRSSVR